MAKAVAPEVDEHLAKYKAIQDGKEEEKGAIYGGMVAIVSFGSRSDGGSISTAVQLPCMTMDVVLLVVMVADDEDYHAL